MITIQSPIEIKTELGTLIIQVDQLNGRVTIHTFQTNGKKVYRLSTSARDGVLHQSDS